MHAPLNPTKPKLDIECDNFVSWHVEQELLRMWCSSTASRRVLCWMKSVRCTCASETSVPRTCRWLGLKMGKRFFPASSILPRAWTSTVSTPCSVFSNSPPRRTTGAPSSGAGWPTAPRWSPRRGSSQCRQPTACVWGTAPDVGNSCISFYGGSTWRSGEINRSYGH